MPQYMLLLYDDRSNWQKISPEEMQKALEKYMAWTKKPFMVDSKRLGPDPGRVIKSEAGKPRAKDGPYSETKEVLGGFYLIEADNYEQAVQPFLNTDHLTDRERAMRIGGACAKVYRWSPNRDGSAPLAPNAPGQSRLVA